MSEDLLVSRVEAALDVLPTSSGGPVVVLATSGHPPAMALLSSGDIRMAHGRVNVAVHSTSSAISRLGGAFTLLVPLDEIAARIEVINASVDSHSPLAILEGDVVAVRPTSEPPWTLELRFRPESEEHPQILSFVDYWAQVRAWLSGEILHPPTPPGWNGKTE